MAFSLGAPYRLHPSVGLRPEGFGALAYHYETRTLTFLKDAQLTDVVRQLADHPSVSSTLVALGVPAARRAGFSAALERLADAQVICVRD